MALLSANRKRVIVEGPVCESSQVLGWHLRKINNETETKPPIHISSFAFNSSILWDPERWGRPSSVEGTKQVIHWSFKFCSNLFYKICFLIMKKLVVEDKFKCGRGW